MRTILISVVLLLSLQKISSAQETFKIQNASREYDLTVQIEACGGAEQDNDANTCSGKARISINRKGADSPFQVLNLRNVEIYKDTIAHNAKLDTKPRELYEEEYSFVFEDFDFDGNQDLAVCNGRLGGYGGPSYNVYLFNKQLKKFIENRRLTKLTEGYLGLFFVDSKKKQLVAYSKSGCCYHETDKYKLMANKPILVEKIIEEAHGTDDGGYHVVITTRKLVNGRWVKRVTKKKEPPEKDP